MSPATASGPIRIVEVGPRDGLQNEKEVIPLQAKIELINALSRTGLKEIEAGAFVRPDRIPQMADTAELFKSIKREKGVTYSALVPNEQGLDKALDVGVDKIAVFTAASETFNKKNINATISESIERFRPVVSRAKKAKLAIRAYVSTAFWCPYEGKIQPRKVLEVCKQLIDLGVGELSIGDTIGKAAPNDVRALLKLILPKIPNKNVFMHFHDTYGMAIANALCSWQEFGVTGFDSSIGGLGGCPYAPGASGNVSTEDLLYAFEASGAKVPAKGADISAIGRKISSYLGHPLRSRLSNIVWGQAPN